MKRAFLLFLLTLFCTDGLWARSAFDTFFSPGSSADYALSVEPGHDGSPRVLNQKIGGSLQTLKTESRSWTLTGGASYMDLSQPVPIPRSTVVFPDSLGSLDGGISYLRKRGDRRQWGANTTVGSASDKLFHSIYETEVQLTFSGMLPSRTYNAWVFLLNYSNNRTFLNNVPLPGVLYLWNLPGKGLQVMAGFPIINVTYRPAPAWSGKVSLVGGTNQTVEIARLVRGPVWAYASFQHIPEQWLRAGRDNHDNRLIYDEKKALLGTRCDLNRAWSIDLSGGRTFDRRLFEARDSSHTGAPRANLSNGWIINASLSTRWGLPPPEKAKN